MVPLPETGFKIVFSDTSQQCCHVASDSAIPFPFRAFFNLGKSQKSQGAKSGE
jgi:hypothetical protein